MKMIKMALLGGAALAVTAAGAQADDLAELKAQIESLNARVAQMEAAPAVPAGYSLMTLSDGTATVVPGFSAQEQRDFDGPVTVIGVLPTADAPAAATVEWNGYVRAILGLRDTSDDGEDMDADIFARGRLNVTARTDTAVGEIGVRMRIEGNSAGNVGDDNNTFVLSFAGASDLYVDMPVAWGWWQMTPELAFGGGYQGSLSSIGFGYDGACTCHFIDNADVYANLGDTTQMRLSYVSGPMSFAIALEDASKDLNFTADKGLGGSAEFAYSGDSFSGEISGGWRATEGASTVNEWQVGAGLGFSFDPVALSFAGGIGTTRFDNDYWFVNGLAAFSFSDEFRMELGAGYKDYSPGDNIIGVQGGLYYVPVDQLTIGLEAELEMVESHTAGQDDFDRMWAGLVTVWSF